MRFSVIANSGMPPTCNTLLIRGLSRLSAPSAAFSSFFARFGVAPARPLTDDRALESAALSAWASLASSVAHSGGCLAVPIRHATPAGPGIGGFAQVPAVHRSSVQVSPSSQSAGPVQPGSVVVVDDGAVGVVVVVVVVLGGVGSSCHSTFTGSTNAAGPGSPTSLLTPAADQSGRARRAEGAGQRAALDLGIRGVGERGRGRRGDRAGPNHRHGEAALHHQTPVAAVLRHAAAVAGALAVAAGADVRAVVAVAGLSSG